MLILVTGHMKLKLPHTTFTKWAEKVQNWFEHQKVWKTNLDQNRHNVSQKDKWKRNNDKHLVKIPFEDIADKDGQDMVDMDKLYIHIIDTLNCFLIVS